MANNVSRRGFLKLVGATTASTAAAATTAGLGATPALAETADATYRYVSDYGTDILDESKLQELEDACSEWSIKEVEEGAVLLLNNNNALPLSEGDKITLLGNNSIETTNEVEQPTGFGAAAPLSGPFYSYHSGGDAAAGVMVPTRTYLSCIESAFEINPTMVEAYQKAEVYRYKSAEEPEIGETPISLYTDDIKASFAEYGDAAVYMITRQASEDCDLMIEDPTGISALALHPEEIDLLNLIKEQKDAGVFKKVIVLVNSSWAVEIGDLADYGVDAVLWIGAPGSTGFDGVVNILKGAANPSGHLVDCLVCAAPLRWG